MGVSMAEPGTLQQQRKPCLGLERGSWLAQRGGTEGWPREEGEDGTEMLHRQRLAMLGERWDKHTTSWHGQSCREHPDCPSEA